MNGEGRREWNAGSSTRRRLLLVVMVLALCSLVACSSSAGASHACDLLTTSDVEDLLGVPANGGYEDTDRSSGTYCEWRSEDSDDGHDASSDSETVPYFISVTYEQSLSAAQSFESGRERAENKDRDLRGLGNAAHFDGRHGLQVRRGDQVFTTYSAGNRDHPLSNAESRAIERAAADIIIDRIGDPGENPDLDAALECGRTGRCSGARFRACDLLEVAEIEAATEWTVTRTDGTATPSGSDDAGVCTFYLEHPNPPDDLRYVRRVEIGSSPTPKRPAPRTEKRARTRFVTPTRATSPSSARAPSTGRSSKR